MHRWVVVCLFVLPSKSKTKIEKDKTLLIYLGAHDTCAWNKIQKEGNNRKQKHVSPGHALPLLKTTTISWLPTCLSRQSLYKNMNSYPYSLLWHRSSRQNSCEYNLSFLFTHFSSLHFGDGFQKIESPHSFLSPCVGRWTQDDMRAKQGLYHWNVSLALSSLLNVEIGSHWITQPGLEVTLCSPGWQSSCLSFQVAGTSRFCHQS